MNKEAEGGEDVKKVYLECLYILYFYRNFDHLGQFYTMTNIGDIIRIKRIEMGISQKELASQIGCDVSFICKIEKKLRLGKIELVLNILNLDFIFMTKSIQFLKMKIIIINNIINKCNV